MKNNYEKYAEAVVRAVSEYIGLSTENTYTVKKGDSLWSIAKKYNTIVEQLKAANNLTSNLLNVGQTLKIPQIEISVEPGEYTVYIVKSGDNLYNIAKRYNLNVKDIVDYNNLATTNLSVGQRLLIPTSPTTPTEEYQTYTVKKGDNLYSIANRYNTTVDAIKSLNNLTSNILSINQKLLLPSTDSEITYIVKKGDNLYSIANRYNTTVDAIKKKNNLTSNLLNIGQILKI